MISTRATALCRFALGLGATVLLPFGSVAHADPADTCEQVAAGYDYIVGTQAFGSKQVSPDRRALLNQAKEIRALGSNTIKFSLGKRQAMQYGFGDAARNARTELEYVKSAKGPRQVLDMDFRYYQFWVQTFTGSEWRDGVSKDEARAYYNEIYDLTAWLLKRYSGTGKTFMLGNWEGDWLLNGGAGKAATPPPEAIQGMIDWLNIRQKAVDDAKSATPHHDVEVFHYAEVNLVKRALEGRPSLALSVLPATNVDLVSYSSYEAIKQSQVPDIAAIRDPLTRIVHFLQGQLKPKPGLPFANRVFIGEFGYHANADNPLSVEQQFLKSRFVMQVGVELDMPFVLTWQLYNNEVEPNGSSANMGLFEDSGRKRALYYLHEQFLGPMTNWVADSCRKSGHAPSRDAFRTRALELLPTLTFERMDKLARKQSEMTVAPLPLKDEASDRGSQQANAGVTDDD